jgi:hypothetical protein
VNNIPEGYALEITTPPQQSANEPYIYIASYTNPSNEYFVIQAGDPGEGASTQSNWVETYTTASGLVLHFTEGYTDPGGKTYSSAIMVAADGVTLTINSTLPVDTVKAWAEDLTLVK